MARVSAEEVRSVFSNTTFDNDALLPFIDSANTLVTSKCSGEYTSDELRQIELWLSAHFAAVSDQQKRREEYGDAEDEFAGQYGLGLDHTRFGQQVKLLEYHGILADLEGKGRTAELKVLGP